jgi:hypothetical protein
MKLKVSTAQVDLMEVEITVTADVTFLTWFSGAEKDSIAPKAI